MFGFGKKAKAIPSHAKFIALTRSLPASEFIESICRLVETSDPGSRVHTLVAYQNLESILWIMDKWVADGATSITPGIDGYLDNLSTTRPTNEIGERRVGWLTTAALLRRAELIASGQPEHHRRLARTWLQLSNCGPLIHSCLRHNVIWSAEEKEWFEPIVIAETGKVYDIYGGEFASREAILRHVAPKWLKAHPILLRRKRTLSRLGFRKEAEAAA